MQTHAYIYELCCLRISVFTKTEPGFITDHNSNHLRTQHTFVHIQGGIGLANVLFSFLGISGIGVLGQQTAGVNSIGLMLLYIALEPAQTTGSIMFSTVIGIYLEAFSGFFR